MDFLFPYSETKLKPYLKMAVQRIQIHNNKKTTAVKIQKKEVAQLLREGKDDKARIRAEHIIREDFNIEGLEILELILELIHERIKQISSAKECPPDLKEAVSSAIWASKVVDIPELKEVSSQLSKKFGSKFAEAASKNENNEVNIRLLQKLSYRPPSKKLVRNYLTEIAKTYEVKWEPSPDDFENEHLPYGSPDCLSVPMAPGSQLAGAYSVGLESEAPVAGFNSVAPHLRLNEAELVEYQQFLDNQVGSRSASAPIPYAPPSFPSANISQNNNNQGHAAVGYAVSDHEDFPIVEAHLVTQGTLIHQEQSNPSAPNIPSSPGSSSNHIPNNSNNNNLRTGGTPSPPPTSTPAASANNVTASNNDNNSLDALQARLNALHRR